MTSAPKVSVIIPVYNTGKYLRQCLDSVVNQTLKDIEIICINDGSTDNSLQILNEYVAKDARMKIINSKNGGPGGSRNAGLNIAKSNYIMFVDSDDWIQLNTLEIFLNKMLTNDVDVVIGEYAILTKEKSLYSTVEDEQKWFDKFNIPEGNYKFNGSFLSYCRVVHNKLYKKEIIDKYNMRFPIGLINQDEAFHAIYFSCIENIYHINKRFYNRIVHSNSVMRKREQTGKGVTDIIYDVEYIFDFLVKNNLHNKYKTGFRNLFKLHITAALNRCKKYEIYEQAKRKVKELCIKCGIDINLFDLQDATKVSVIIPVYNTGKYLRQCLDSVVNQTLKDIEIICVNDGSTDNSSKILQEYAQKDARVKIINQEQQGAGKAKNIGIENTHGEYLAFIDSDDYISTDYFEVLYSIATASKADIAATSNVTLSYADETLNKNKEMGFDNQRILKSITEKGQIIISSGVVCNKIYKKFLVEKYKIRFSNIMCTGEDNIFNIIAVITSNLIACTNKAKYFYRQRQNSSVAVKKDIRHFAILDIYNEILVRVFELNLSSQWSEIIYKRMNLDFGYHFNGFNAELKKEFLNEIRKMFPSSLHFVKNVELQNRKLILSLTSYPARINVVHKAILTLLEQTKKADKVILWLANEDFPNKEQDLPRELTELTKRGLTISWCKDIKSYKKLIPALKEYPEYAIVTADDDAYYPKDWLEKLYMEYIKQPNMVHCHRAHGITFRYENILPYLQWNFLLEGAKTKPSFRNFPTGSGGILYPPHIFYRDILREDLFLKLLTSTDDIWFWAMCVLNNIKINVVKNNIRFIKNIENSQEVSLWSINKNNINDENLQKIFYQYPQLYKKIRKYTIPYSEYAQLVFCVYNENTHKVFKIFGLKIKLRKERLLKFRKNITSFLENILCIKNDGIYKVIGIFRIKIKIKRKHKELLVKLKEQENNIKNLKDEIKNIVLSQTQDFKKELINKTDSVKKQVSDTLLTHKDEIKNIVLSQTQDFKKELINICKNNEHLNYTQLESLFWLSKRLKIKNSLPPMRNWAMSPDVLLKLHEYITNAKPKIVLEFGSGVSTIVICDALRQNNSGRLISIEHLEKFMKETVEVIKNENLSSFLDLRLAQLKIWTGEHLCNEKPVFWYDEKVIDNLDLKEIDLLIIDGPPGNTNPYARYPVLPVLHKNLSNGVQIWLDDSNRKDEATIANTWAEKYKLISNFFNLEKGLVVLEKSN